MGKEIRIIIISREGGGTQGKGVNGREERVKESRAREECRCLIASERMRRDMLAYSAQVRVLYF